jgi:hypothetical protein
MYDLQAFGAFWYSYLQRGRDSNCCFNYLKLTEFCRSKTRT